MEFFAPQTYQYRQTPHSDPIEAHEELWRWQAIYKDNTALKQFDDDTGSFHKMAEIDTAKLHALYITSRKYRQTYTVLFPEEPYELFIKHYRITLGLGSLEEVNFTKFVFGYKTQSGKESYLVIMPRGLAIMTDDYNKVEPV